MMIEKQDITSRISGLDNSSKHMMIFVTLLVTVCFQFSDIKIFNIKVYELMLLVIASFTIWRVRKLHVFIFLFLLFFILLVLKTIIQNPAMEFFINTDLPFLKMPYWLTVSRGVEYFCSIYFVFLLVDFFKNRVYSLYEWVYFIVQIQTKIFFPIFLLFFILYFFDILQFKNFQGFLVYDTSGSYGEVSARLKGFFVEGGPFGLYYSYLYFINAWVQKELGIRNYTISFLIILIVLMSASKAGYVLIILYHLIQFYFKIRNADYSPVLKRSIVIFSILSTGVAIYLLLFMYLGQIGNELILEIVGDEVDRNWMMGRMAAITLVPNMLSEYFWIGIGLGNYSLIRNNPKFLGGFPEIPVKEWDLTGLGGIMDMLVDGGIILFIFFIGIFIFIFNMVKFNQSLLILFFSFVLPYVAGAQFYFIYPWFSLALIIILLNNKKSLFSGNAVL
jgi:hypothetical protein